MKKERTKTFDPNARRPSIGERWCDCLLTPGRLVTNKVIRPKSRASALSEKSGRQIDEQTTTDYKTFELAVYL